MTLRIALGVGSTLMLLLSIVTLGTWDYAPAGLFVGSGGLVVALLRSNGEGTNR